MKQDSSLDPVLEDPSFRKAFSRGAREFLTGEKYKVIRLLTFIGGCYFGIVIGGAAHTSITKELGTSASNMANLYFAGIAAAGTLMPLPLAACAKGLKRAFTFWAQRADLNDQREQEQRLAQAVEEKERHRQHKEAIQSLRREMADEDRTQAIEEARLEGYYQGFAAARDKQKSSSEQQGTRFAARESVVAEGGQGVSRKTKFTLG